MPAAVSVPVEHSCEIVNFTPVNPLISRCEIKVCYVSDEPNRNRSVITKDVAKNHMVKTLPGCPIVGFFNEADGDFEEHNRTIDVSNGRFKVIDMTRPYGFVDLNAKVWFQKFLDDGVEHEYLMTEGYIWNKIYPEAEGIIEHGNNQSMELHKDTLKGEWATDDNGMPKFFIINEAMIEKLCVLGRNVEPCFEGAAIATEFSLDEGFKNALYAMVDELKQVLQEGGTSEMELNENKIVTEEEEILDPDFKKKDDEEEDKKEKENQDKSDKENTDNSDEDKKGEEEEDEDEKKKKAKYAAEEEDKEEKKCPECGKPMSECKCKEKDKEIYSLEEIPEYVQLKADFEKLQADYALNVKELESLRQFKAQIEKKDKEAMIESFYMLSDEDKADVIANIDTYSLDDIEAKLSIICVRNKVNFNLEDDNKEAGATTYTLDSDDDSSDVPAWIKAVRETAKNMI